jgi:hypothetical protein
MAMNPYVRGYRFTDCRLLGHLWHVVPSDWTPEYGHPMTTRCERCNIERRDSVNRNSGEVESRRYVYPDGYLFSHEDGIDLPHRSDFRLAWLSAEVSKVRQSKAKARRAA